VIHFSGAGETIGAVMAFLTLPMWWRALTFV